MFGICVLNRPWGGWEEPKASSSWWNWWEIQAEIKRSLLRRRVKRWGERERKIQRGRERRSKEQPASSEELQQRERVGGACLLQELLHLCSDVAASSRGYCLGTTCQVTGQASIMSEPLTIRTRILTSRPSQLFSKCCCFLCHQTNVPELAWFL